MFAANSATDLSNRSQGGKRNSCATCGPARCPAPPDGTAPEGLLQRRPSPTPATAITAYVVTNHARSWSRSSLTPCRSPWRATDRSSTSTTGSRREPIIARGEPDDAASPEGGRVLRRSWNHCRPLPEPRPQAVRLEPEPRRPLSTGVPQRPPKCRAYILRTSTSEALSIRRSKGPLTCDFTCSGGGI